MKPSALLLFAIFITPFLSAQNSIKFDGTNDYVSVNSGGPTGSSSRTIEVWVKTNSNASNSSNKTQALVEWGTTGNTGRRYFLSLRDYGKPRIEMGGNGFTSNTLINDGKWHHIAVTFNNSSSPAARIYIDGELDISNNFTRTVNTSSANISIGRRVNASNYFKGEMDEIRIWSKDLSQSEIRNWMCQELNSGHPSISNLYAYWKVDQQSGTTLTDASGNSRTATLRNGASLQNFGAPIGTQSVTSYASNPNLVLKHPDGDSVLVNGVSGSPDGVHLYLRNGTPNYSGLPSQIHAIDSSRHWGVFMAGGNSPKYDIEYFYLSNTHYQSYGSCSNALIQRADNSDTSWTYPTATSTASSYKLTGQSESEFMLGYSNQSTVITAPGGKDTTQVCAGDSIILSGSSGAIAYQWLLNGAALSADTNSSKIVMNAGGSYQLVVQGATCSDTSNALQIQILSLPSVTLAPFASVCEDTFSIPFAGGLPNGGTYSSTYASGNIFVVSTAGPGHHQIIYEYTDAQGCSDTASTSIEVWALPQVSLSTKTDVCADSSAHPLGGGLPAGGFYEVNGVQNTQFDPVTLGAGNHWIHYDYTDANGCSNRDSVIAVVLPLPSVSLNLIKDEFCEYDAVAPMDGQNPRGGLFSGVGVVGNNYSPPTAGVGNHPIEYLYTDPGTGCKNTARDTIEVFARPATPILTQVNNSLEAKSPGAVVYRWYNLTRQINGANDSIYKPIIEGDYYAQVQSAEGCWSLLSDTISYQVITGVIDAEWKEQLSIYPNPFRDQLHIDFETNENLRVTIRSISGQALIEQERTSSNEALNIAELNAGIYLLELRDANGQVITIQRIVKE